MLLSDFEVALFLCADAVVSACGSGRSVCGSAQEAVLLSFFGGKAGLNFFYSRREAIAACLRLRLQPRELQREFTCSAQQLVTQVGNFSFRGSVPGASLLLQMRRARKSS